MFAKYRLLGGATLLLGALAGCGFDLSLPEAPQRGEVRGVLDTAGNVSPEGLEIFLVAESGSRQSQTALATGAFVFSDLQPGLYFLEAKVPGFAPFIRPSVRVRSGQTLDVGTLTLTWLESTPSEATVTGKVVVNGGGDATGGQVEFILEGVDKRVALSAVGIDGAFVQRVVPGTYTLKASHPHYVTSQVTGVAVQAATDLDLTESPLVMELNPATLNGSVLKERDGQAPVPAEGALVTLDNGTTTTTDTSGNFVVTGLAAGTRQVRVSLAGFHDATSSHSVTLTPGNTSTLEPVSLKLDRGAIVGTVEMADRQAVRDVTVAVTGTPFSAVVAPDATDPWRGTFRISGVPAGTWEVSATKSRYSRSVVGNVVVTSDGTANAGTFTLTLLQGDFLIEDPDAANTAGYTRSTSVNLDLSGFSSAASFRASEDPDFNDDAITFDPFSSPQKLEPFTLGNNQGTHTVYAQYKDASGTASPVFTASIVLDTVGPESPSLLLNGGAAFTRQAQPLQVTLTANESLPAGVDAVSGLAWVRLAESGTLDAQGKLVASRQPYKRDDLFTRASAADGVQDVFAQFEDHAGNVSAVVTARIVIDTVAPTGSIAIANGAGATAPGFTRTSLVSLTQTLTAPEPNQGYVLIKVANSQADLPTAVFNPVNTTSSWFLDPVGQGTKTVYAVLQDAAGNTSPTLSATITYDSQPPSPVTATLVGSPSTNASSVTLNVTATDAYPISSTQGLTVSEDAFFSTTSVAPGPMAAQVTVPLSAGDGAKTLYVRFRDVAGNDAFASVSLTKDTLAPTGTLQVLGTLADGTASSTLTATSAVTVTLIESGATEYVMGNDTLTTCPTGGYTTLTSRTFAHTLSGTASPREVRMCLRDAAGNTTGPLVATIALDSTAPAGCTLAVTGRNKDGTAAIGSVTASANVSAAVSCTDTPTEIFLTTGTVTCGPTVALSWQAFADTSAVTLSTGDGSKTVRGCVRDAARNVTSLTAVNLTLDTTAPTPASATLVGGTPTKNDPATFNVAASDTNGLHATQGLTISEDPFFALPIVGPKAFSAGAESVDLSNGDGEKTVYVRFRDVVGNESVVTVSVVKDTVAPTGTITVVGTLADGTTSSELTATTSVTVNVSQNGANDYLLGNETLTTCPATGYTPLNSGSVSYTLSGTATPRQVRLCLRDTAGNLTGPLTASIALDSAAPTSCALTLTGKNKDGTPATGTVTASATVDASVTCAETPKEMFLTTGAVTCSPTATLSWQPYSATSAVTLANGDGSKSVRGCVRDAARNVTTLTAAAITLDTTAPTPATATLVGGSPTKNDPVTFNVSATDTNGLHATQGLTISEDPFFNVAIVGPKALSAATESVDLSNVDGEKTVYVRFRDAVGNDAVVTVNVVKDTTAPTGSLTVVGTLADGTTSSEVTSTTSVTVNVSHSGASEYLLGNDTLTTCPASGYTQLTSGSISHTLSGTAAPRQVRLCLRDAAGNTSGPLTATIALDTAAPTGCVVTLTGKNKDGTPATGSVTASTNIEAGVTCTETPRELFLTTGAVTCSPTATIAWQTYSATTAVTLPTTDGSKSVRGCVRDAARNVTTLTAANITLDTAAPTPATATLVGSTPTKNDPVTFNVSATDTNGLHPTQGLTISEDPFFNVAIVGPKALSAATESVDLSNVDGEKTVYVRFRDVVGNDSVVTVSLVKDTTAPTGSLTVVGTLADGAASSEITSTPSVTVNVTQSGATEYLLGNDTLSTCPASGYTTLPATNSISHTLTGTAQPRQVKLCLRDGAGNTTGPLTASITLDTAAPSGCTLTVTGKNKDGTAATGSVTANANVEAGVTCAETPRELYLTTGAVTCSPTLPIVWPTYSASSTVALPTGDGGKTVRGCVRDAARNVTSLTAVNVTLDTAGPTPATATLSGTTPTRNDPVTLNVSATDTNGLHTTQGLTISEDPFFSQSLVGPKALSAATESVDLSAGDGEKTVYVRFRDVVGNESFVTVSLVLDTTAPTGSIVLQGALGDGEASTAVTTTNSLTLLLTQNGATEYLAGSGTVASCPTGSYTSITSNSIPLTVTGSGSSRSAWLCLRDPAGNTTLLTDSITFDNTSVTGCALSVAGTKVDGSAAPTGKTASTKVQATVTGCTLANSDEIYLASGTVVCSATDTFNWKRGIGADQVLLSGLDGSITVSGCVRDAARNVTSITSASITLDTTPPFAPRLVLDNGATWVNQADVTTRLGYKATAKGFASSATEWAVSESDTIFPAFSTFAVNQDTVNFTFSTASDGEKVLYALFRDDVGNISAVASDSIAFDTAAPSPVAFAVVSPRNNNFVASLSVLVTLGSSDAQNVFLANDLGSAGCAADDFSSAIAQVYSSTYSHILLGTDGTKTVCVRLRDAAGNLSTIFSDDIELDTTAPTAPRVLTTPQVLNPGSVLGYSVDIRKEALDLHPDHFQVLGGTALDWAPQLPVDNGTRLTFAYTLHTNDTLERGAPNLLRVRAIDMAGNAGAEGSVLITVDTNSPEPVELNNFWVQNGDHQAIVHWQDTVNEPESLLGYEVHYAPAPGNPAVLTTYNGQFAAQGPSPIEVSGNMHSVTLTGLPNGALTYVTVRAVDYAKNRSPEPAASPLEVALQPNEVSPNLLMDVQTFSDLSTNVRKIIVQDDWAYALGATDCYPGPGAFNVEIKAINLAQIVSPVQRGEIFPNPPGPTPMAPVSQGSVSCSGGTAFTGPWATDIAVDGPWLFAAAGRFIRIYRVDALQKATPPAPVATLDLGAAAPTWPNAFSVHALAARGGFLFASTWVPSLPAPRGRIVAISLATLYDNNASSFPTVASSIVGMSTSTVASAFDYQASSLTWSRDKLIASTEGPNGAGAAYFDISDALDNNAGTPWDTGDYVGFEGTAVPANHNSPAVSGNLLLAIDDDQTYFRTLNDLWSVTTPPLLDPYGTVASYGGQGTFDVAGNQAFVGFDTGIRTMDLSDLSDLRHLGTHDGQGYSQTRSSALYGNYLLSGTDSGSIRVAELATPTSLHTKNALLGPGPRIEVTPGLVFSSTAAVNDLLAGNTIPQLNTALSSGSSRCSYDGVRIDETMVVAHTNRLRMFDMKLAMDRMYRWQSVSNPWSDLPASTNAMELLYASGRRPTGLAVHGSYLVVAEIRDSADLTKAEVWLSVYDARNLRDDVMSAASTLPSPPTAEYKVSDYAAPLSTDRRQFAADVSMHNGRAVVTVSRVVQFEYMLQPSPGLMFVDLRPVFDDNSATNLVAVGSLGQSRQGALNVTDVREVVIRGNYAFATVHDDTPLGGGLHIFDITAAMDDDSTTQLAAGLTPLSSVSFYGADSLAVYGSYAIVTPQGGVSSPDGIRVVDISKIGTPAVVGFIPYSGMDTSCIPNTGLESYVMHGSTVVQGTQLYVSSQGRLEIFDLE